MTICGYGLILRVMSKAIVDTENFLEVVGCEGSC